MSYLLGSISSAILICRVFGLPDPRTSGSRNPGTTNVLRVGGKLAAAATLLGDVAKGIAPVLIATELNAPPIVIVFCGLCAFLGHLYPIYFDFRGGKGVATAIGVALALHWPAGLLIVATWAGTLAITRTASQAALVSGVAAPFYFYLTTPSVLQDSYPPVIAIMSLLLIGSHHKNILNLYRGDEYSFEDSDKGNSEESETPAEQKKPED